MAGLNPTVYISSTFADLAEHRQHVLTAISQAGLQPWAFEISNAAPGADQILAGLQEIERCDAVVLIIGHRYGLVPISPELNPHQFSLSEVAFNKAVELGLPTLVFIMSDQHPIRIVDLEADPQGRSRRAAFVGRVKRSQGESDHIYETFDSVDDFAVKAASAIKMLAGRLRDSAEVGGIGPRRDMEAPRRPVPPALRAIPAYPAPSKFVGRANELRILDEWGAASGANPMMLIEAIGGSGKSNLTWQWVTNHAPAIRGDWTGRFWYSFYEGGAVMANFCREALAYMTTGDPRDFASMRTPELGERLVAELQREPWLLVLDGLERILVAYHRIDAAQLRDEEAETSSDFVAQRDPRDAISPDDDDLLLRLTDAAPSRILISSRLTPLSLVGRTNTPRVGVASMRLGGLTNDDAEKMIRSFGVYGDAQAIQDYLQQNCDGHPLVIGALAGMIRDYSAAPCNFDAWLDAPQGGHRMDLSRLDLRQKQNHILVEAVSALPPNSRALLYNLSLLARGVDYQTLLAIYSPEATDVE